MRCPHCGNEVPARPTCLRCGESLFGSPAPALPATARGPITIPLTLGQKTRLIMGCVPLVFFALMVAGYLLLARSAIIPAPSGLFFVFIGVVMLVTGYQAIQRLRDLAAGVAQVQEDLLNRSYRSRSGGSAYGRFERLGSMHMRSAIYVQHAPGRRYRVVYSPASKIVWALEPPDQRIRAIDGESIAP